MDENIQENLRLLLYRAIELIHNYQSHENQNGHLPLLDAERNIGIALELIDSD